MRRAALLLCLAMGLWAGAGSAQQSSPILIIEQDRILSESLPGRALLARQDADAQELSRESQALDREFEAEEQRLTDLRDETDPAAFRDLAEAFDARVVETRRAQEQKSTELVRRIEAERRNFLVELRPLLIAFMQETGASAIMDQRAVLIANQDLNITDEVIKRLNDAYRAGQPPAPDE